MKRPITQLRDFSISQGGFTPLDPERSGLQAGDERSISSKFNKGPALQGGDLTGFTLFEAVVVMALLVIIAGILLANSPSLNQRINLQRTAQELALGLRRAQSMALAVRQVPGPTGVLVPPAFGVYVTRLNPTRYLIFADLRVAGVNDRRYRPGDDLVIETVNFGAGVSLTDLRSEIDTANIPQDALSVAFTVPEASMSLANDSAPVGASARMTLSSPALTYVRNITVRVSGEISTR